MTTNYVTTPVGRRTMALAVLKHQFRPAPAASSSIDKWKIYRALCEAKPTFGLTDRALAVLNALLSFYPKSELSAGERLVVFPSNTQLSLRAHGMAEQTIRRHIAVLVSLGFIKRKDSPNGKRYARKDRQGAVSDAYGFDLTPLLARAREIERAAAEVETARLALQRCREQISVCRRDIAKMIDAARAHSLPGDWDRMFNTFRDIIDAIPRSPDLAHLEFALTALLAIHQSVSNQLERLEEIASESANTPQIERHIQDSKPESYFESALQIDETETSAAPVELKSGDTATTIVGQPLHQVPLDLVLKTCPDIQSYAPNGMVRNWDHLIHASIVVGKMLGITSSAMRSAQQVMGARTAAIVLGCILERITAIASPGGYLRQLTQRCQQGSFSSRAMIQAISRARLAETNGDFTSGSKKYMF